MTSGIQRNAANESSAGWAEAQRRIQQAENSGEAGLDLSELGIETLPETLGDLTHLQRLSLFKNRLSALPEWLGSLTRLQLLYLHNNRLSTLPEWVGNLTGLQQLSLANNQFHALPESLGNLASLRELYLSNNQFSTPPAWLGNLKGLRRLALSNNQLKTLPESLGNLASLVWLYLHNNQLVTLPEWLGNMTGLRLLSLSNNQLEMLPEALGKLTRLEGLYLHENPALGLPEEVLGPTRREVDNGKKAAPPADILAYYFKSKKKSRPLNEVKMLLVGRGEAGKSSIRDCLLGFGFDPKKKETSGIQIDPWKIDQARETLRVHVWDFAGQELTHGTHQFFLTERSVYILVLDGRADTQDRDAEYWLRLISAFGGGSPVIIALNKFELKPFDVDRFAILERFPRVCAFIETDCASGLGITALREKVIETVAGLEGVRESFPEAWERTKNALSEMKESYVSFEDFRVRCHAHGVTEKKDQETLARTLHRLGIVLHYGDDPRLRDTTVLKPHWVTESIYTLLRVNQKVKPGAKENPKARGCLTLADAEKALPNEKTEMVRYLIGLMRRFELCFPVDETEERWLVPELLSRFQPPLKKEWLVEDALRLRYGYKVLPEGLLPRFITRTYPLSEGQPRWRGGVVLEVEGARALVRGDAANSHVNVAIVGEAEGRQRLAKLVRHHFAQIHADLKGLEPEELVEVEGHTGNFKSVATLERDEHTRNVTTIETREGSVPIDQTRELNRISTPAARDPERRRLQLFLSYSHKDAGLRDVFQENLALLEQDGLVDTWFDGKILPSAQWDKEIRREMEEADIIVFLVSTNLLSSKYVSGVEMKRALELRNAKEVEIVSVILEDCAWKGREFTKYQTVLPDGKAVRKWRHHRSAFNEVEKSLRRVIEDILACGSGRERIGTPGRR